MDLSVIILNWNAREWLERSVGTALAQEAPGRSIEVVFVDNASTDGSAESVRQRFPGTRVLSLPKNLGFAGGNNVGIAYTSSRYVLLLNPDTETHPGAFAALLDFAEANPKAGIIGPKILNPDGSLQYSCRRFATLEAGLFRNTPLGKLFPHNRFTTDYLMQDVSHDEPMQVDWVSGAAMLIRRAVLESVGTLDEAFFMYSEDVDLCWRAHEAGWEVWYAPEAVITHAIGQSSNKAPVRMIVAFHRSMFRWYRKHYLGKRYPAWLTPVVAAGLTVRALLVMGMGLWHKVRRKRV